MATLDLCTCDSAPLERVSASASSPTSQVAVEKTAKSWASSPSVRRSMQGNRSRDTRPELAVRSAAHARGLRYRVCTRPIRELACTADMVFRKAKVAIFVDGCFWHGCPTHGRRPKTNSQYWGRKIDGNIARDRRNTKYLVEQGWHVLRFWEHEDIHRVAERITSAVRQRVASECVRSR